MFMWLPDCYIKVNVVPTCLSSREQFPTAWMMLHKACLWSSHQSLTLLAKARCHPWVWGGVAGVKEGREVDSGLRKCGPCTKPSWPELSRGLLGNTSVLGIRKHHFNAQEVARTVTKDFFFKKKIIKIKTPAALDLQESDDNMALSSGRICFHSW